MKIVLTNDDGIDAPGLPALERACRELGELTVVAPARHQSAVGHAVTNHRAIGIEERGEGRWAVQARPADCARIAVRHLVPDADLVVSGINFGGNLGTDVYPSGTVAAARRRPSSAAGRSPSPSSSPGDATWTGRLTARRAVHPITRILERSGEAASLWNVNLPHPEGEHVELEVVDCPLDPNPLDVKYREVEEGLWFSGDYHARRREPGHDVDVCFSGRIAVTRLEIVAGRG